MEILVIGNPHVKEDSLCLDIAKSVEIAGVTFLPCTDVDHFMKYCEDREEVTVMDVADGIKEAAVIHGPAQLKERQLYSLHDFDIGFAIQLLERMGVLPEIKIIAVPKGMREARAIEAVRTIVSSMQASG